MKHRPRALINPLKNKKTRSTYAGVVDAGDGGLWPVQDEEGGQVSSVGGYDDHSETRPYHAQHTRTEAAGGALRMTMGQYRIELDFR